jgi:hypothetical protein
MRRSEMNRFFPPTLPPPLADNLFYVAGNLLIQEDTGRHENNVL